jgi:hypothetical protein
MVLVLAIIFLIGGVVLRFQINKRQFNRRNAAGVEEFKSYGRAYTTQMAEKLGRLLSLVLIVVGALMLLSYFITPRH